MVTSSQAVLLVFPVIIDLLFSLLPLRIALPPGRHALDLHPMQLGGELVVDSKLISSN